MALHEADREDLLREATAYARRSEGRLDGVTVFAGIKDDGRVSVYFDGDPVFHLDDHARLHRAFVDGDLYRTQGSTLARLERRRTAERTELLRHDLDADELAAFLATIRDRFAGLADGIEAGTLERLRVVPEGDDPWPDVAAVLRAHFALEDLLAPAVPGRK